MYSEMPRRKTMKNKLMSADNQQLTVTDWRSSLPFHSGPVTVADSTACSSWSTTFIGSIENSQDLSWVFRPIHFNCKKLLFSNWIVLSLFTSYEHVIEPPMAKNMPCVVKLGASYLVRIKGCCILSVVRQNLCSTIKPPRPQWTPTVFLLALQLHSRPRACGFNLSSPGGWGYICCIPKVQGVSFKMD